jgi:hypothetical protein
VVPGLRISNYRAFLVASGREQKPSQLASKKKRKKKVDLARFHQMNELNKFLPRSGTTAFASFLEKKKTFQKDSPKNNCDKSSFSNNIVL